MRAISDRFVGYEWGVADRNGRIARVKVLDARAGKDVSNLSAYRGASIYDDQDGFRITDLVLARNGDVAWGVTRPTRFGTRDVRRAPRAARRSTLLVSSPDVEPGSVAMNRSFVYWRQNGVPISDGKG